MSKREKILSLITIIFLMMGYIYIEKNIYGIISFLAIPICSYLGIKFILKTEDCAKLNETAKVNYKRYKMAIDALNGAIWEWDDKSKNLYISDKIKDVLEVRSDIDSFEKWFKFIVPRDRNRIKEEIGKICEEKIVDKFDIRYTLINTKSEDIVINFSGMGRIEKDRFYLSGIIHDITEKVRQEELIKEGNKKYKLVVEGSNNIIFCIDIEKEIIIYDKKINNYFYNNDNDIKLYDDVIITLKQWESYIFNNDLNIYKSKMEKLLYGEEDLNYEFEYRLVNKENKIVWVNSIGKKSIGDDGKLYIYGSLTDITERKKRELKIHFMSYYDDITGIYNRRLFVENLNEYIKNNDNESIAVIFIDLDNFKYINDTYGHDLGDSFLGKFCEEIYKVIDKNCDFARFGGDEFVISKIKIKDDIEVKELLNSIIKRFNDPMQVNGKEVYCTLSIGVSLYPFDGDGVDSLLKKADIAMYKAKTNGKNRYQFFDTKISEEFSRGFEIEKGLRKALDKNEIEVAYQAKVNNFTQEIIGYESLCRWNSLKLGFVSPSEFIPVAERTGLIINIGKFIMEESIKRCKELSLITDKEFKIAINISDIQIRDNEMVKFVSDTLKIYNLSPSYIEFEITESVIMKSVEANIKILRRLKEIGVSIALDDFGTGYSSLSYLKILPIDVLKIDKSFIDGINIDEKSDYIIERIVDLSHHLDIIVVAEGVETREQVEYLRNVNCDIIQGYYYSKPKRFKEAKEMIEKNFKEV